MTACKRLGTFTLASQIGDGNFPSYLAGTQPTTTSLICITGAKSV